MGGFILGLICAALAYQFFFKKSKNTLAEATASQPTLPPRDSNDQEGSLWEIDRHFPVEATLELTYRDAQGATTKRKVDVIRSSEQQSGLLVGHCHMRNEQRTFRLDRILRCVDVETGEVVNNTCDFLAQRYRTSPAYFASKFLEAEYDALRVLLYVGKADGSLRAPEKAIIREACRTLAPESSLTDEAIDALVKQLSTPTMQAFKLAVNRLIDKPTAAKEAILSASARMVATQKTVHPAEQAALDYMQKKLNAAATQA